MSKQTINAQIIEAHQLLGSLTMYECAQALSSHKRDYLPSDLCAEYQKLRDSNKLKVVGEKFNVRTDGKRRQFKADIYALA